MTHHPHVHMIVPGGGLSEDGSRWISSRPRFLVHVNVLSRLFQGRFLALLVKAHTQGRLRFFGDHAALVDRRAFKRFLAPLRKIEWVVYTKNPFAGPQQVLRYLSRYTHRVATPIAVWSQPTTTASRSAGRTIASTAPAAGRR